MRHLFDIMFMLSQKYPIDGHVLHALGIKGPPLEVIMDRVESFSQAELKRQAESLRPFLAKTIIPQLADRYGK